jgi:putative transposase
VGINSMEKRSLIIPNHEKLSVRQQCRLVGLNRSNLYYEAAGESEYNLLLMKLMDEEYTRYPFKGALKMTAYLKELEHNVNIKRVRRLLRLMGLEAIYPKKNLSKSQANHKKYPYLLNGLSITKPNQVWCTDITYIRLAQGFVYLTAIMDWYSRYVLSWRLSNSLDASFCIDALEDALMLYGFPEIFNSDQGSQYTSDGFTEILLANGIKISMDGRGRAFDNIFIERLWRSVKYEEVYLHDYFSVKEAKGNLHNYFNFYNFARHHQSLDYKKPAEVYFGKKIPVDYVNNVNNSLLVPRKVIHIINVGPQAQQ